MSSKQAKTEEHYLVAAAAVGANGSSGWVPLNAKRQCDEASDFEQQLFERVIAQDEAVLALSQLYQIYLAQMALPGKPLGTMLFLGPTGSGKTRTIEAAAEVLFGDAHAMIK